MSRKNVTFLCHKAGNANVAEAVIWKVR